MTKFRIHGGKRLDGVIEVETSKNAALPIIAASILTEKRIVLKNIPHISDVFKMFDILRAMGGRVLLTDTDAIIDNSSISNFEIPHILAKDIRSSI